MAYLSGYAGGRPVEDRAQQRLQGGAVAPSISKILGENRDKRRARRVTGERYSRRIKSKVMNIGEHPAGRRLGVVQRGGKWVLR